MNDRILEARQDGTKGGGGEPTDARGEFRNTAFWAAQVATDDQGRASVSAPLPDNLTTWHAQARAVSGDTMVGEGMNEIVSTLPLLVRPALPRFLRVGDEAVLRILVRNASGADTPVTVSLDAEGVAIASERVQTQAVAAGASGIFAWPAAAEVEGTARLTFSAQGENGASDALRVSLPVYLDVTPETTATGGVVSTTAAREAVYLPDYAIVTHGGLEVAVQSSLFDEYNPLHGVPTGFAEARLSPAALIRRGVEDGEDGLRLLGFVPAITEKDRERLQRVKPLVPYQCRQSAQEDRGADGDDDQRDHRSVAGRFHGEFPGATRLSPLRNLSSIY